MQPKHGTFWRIIMDYYSEIKYATLVTEDNIKETICAAFKFYDHPSIPECRISNTDYINLYIGNTLIQIYNFGVDIDDTSSDGHMELHIYQFNNDKELIGTFTGSHKDIDKIVFWILDYIQL